MRIALDARTIYNPCRRGTGKNLVDLYRAVAALRPDWRVLAYHRCDDREPDLLPSPQIEPRFIEMPGDRFHAWERFRLPVAAWRDGADLLHCPANTAAAWMTVPTVVTIHDLIPLDLPDGRDPADVRYFHQSIHMACQRAAWIICPSRYTRDRLVDQFHADADRITVNPWAPDSRMMYIDPEHWPAVLSQYGIDRPFLLHFGARAPRKNTAAVLEAWSCLTVSDRLQRQLIIVGLDDVARDRARKRAEELGLGSSARIYGFAPEEELPTLLSAAETLVFPSLSEGFGLPILDAWATRTAVLTGNRTSLPEVAGEAALLVDPGDTGAIAAGMAALIRDAALRDRLVAAGTQRLLEFSWRATAERFVDAMERALSVAQRKNAAA